MLQSSVPPLVIIPVLWYEILDTMWSAELFVFNVGTKNQTGLFDTLSAFGTNTQNREGAKLNLLSLTPKSTFNINHNHPPTHQPRTNSPHEGKVHGF